MIAVMLNMVTVLLMRFLRHFICLFLASASLAWAEVGEFLEKEAPFLNTALLIEEGKSEKNIVRRGVLVPLGEDTWACFDTDLLRWAAVWVAQKGKPPITMDSMAAVSYPDKKAKAKFAPRLKGKIIDSMPELPGAGSGVVALPDTRPRLLLGKKGRVGPFPKEQGRWLGLELRGKSPVLRYRIGACVIEEFLPKIKNGNLMRVLQVAKHDEPLHFRVGKAFRFVIGGGVLDDGLLILPSSEENRTITLSKVKGKRVTFPAKAPAVVSFPQLLKAKNPAEKIQNFYAIRPLEIPTSSRAIRPTDIAFLSDGSGLLTTLDGDVWQIQTPYEETSTWRRVASGLFETISIETTSDDRIYVLGRDQITQLIDTNADGYIDEYRNASNAFQQTLMTRDYATSLAIDADGSFLIAKGGINKNQGKKDNELSPHRGGILRISPDGDSVEVLADGLRLPYVGLRQDGSVFASDQQGNFVPSTPLHLISGAPALGFAATNHRAQETTEPLLWYPYQANRSAAAFTNYNNDFFQLSWDGRIFAIETPKVGQAFSWQLPLQFDFPTLNGARNHKSGELYLTGLGISGYKPTTKQLSGLLAIRKIAPTPKPVAMDVQADRIMVTFDRPLGPKETYLPSLRLYNIVRTGKYGSGHFRWDGEPGEHILNPLEVNYSDDRLTLEIRFESIAKSDVLDLTLISSLWKDTLHLYSRPHHLPEPDLDKLAAVVKPKLVAGNAVKGKAHFAKYACAGCHSLDDTKLVGPSLEGLASRADLMSMRQSILKPAAVVVEGYEASMPSFAGVLSDQELEDVLAYLGTLK